MARCELPTGKPHYIKWENTAIDSQTIHSILTHPFYYITVRVLEIKTNLNFPLQSKCKDGIRMFTNDLIGDTLYVDKIALEDFIEYHQATVEILEGYYFKTGNNKIQEVITNMFNL